MTDYYHYELEELALFKKNVLEQCSDLDKRIAKEKKELAALKEQALEAKMHRIAMERIAEDSFESLIKSAGFVKSIHGYPEQARKI